MNDYVTISWVVIISGYLAVMFWLLWPLAKAAIKFLRTPYTYKRSRLAD